jgi:hypothetical protein
MPFSYNGFGPAAILIMLLCLGGKQVYDYIKAYKANKKSVKF